VSDPARLPAKPLARHLMDPNNPRPRQSSQKAAQSLTRVQRWVMSALAVTTIGHFAAGLILAAVFSDESRMDARIGLNVLATGAAVGAVVAFRAIHKLPVLSPWLALGFVVGLVGFLVTF
jgi:uncharacterized membrane protein YoaK (UPF0700 family)